MWQLNLDRLQLSVILKLHVVLEVAQVRPAGTGALVVALAQVPPSGFLQRLRRNARKAAEVGRNAHDGFRNVAVSSTVRRTCAWPSGATRLVRLLTHAVTAHGIAPSGRDDVSLQPAYRFVEIAPWFWESRKEHLLDCGVNAIHRVTVADDNLVEDVQGKDDGPRNKPQEAAARSHELSLLCLRCVKNHPGIAATCCWCWCLLVVGS